MAMTGPLFAARMTGAAVGAVVLGYLVILATSWSLAAQIGTPPLISVFPEPADLTLTRATAGLALNRGRYGKGDLRRIDQAARLDPLDGRPFLLHALALRRSGQTDKAIRLLEISRKRDPRIMPTRLLLFAFAVSGNRVDDALEEAGPTLALLPEARQQIVPLLASLALRKETHGELAGALARSSLRGAVFLRLAQTGASPHLLDELAEPMRGLAKRSGERDWIGAAVASVANRPDLASARRLWTIFEGGDAGRSANLVYDGEFDKDTGAAPFGWVLTPGNAGTAAIEHAGLDIFFYGNQNQDFAAQLLTLAPGTYRLQSSIAANGQSPPTNLYWDIRCAKGGGQLLHAPLTVFAGKANRAVERFTVPAGSCDSQWLKLGAAAPDLREPQAARVNSVSISLDKP